jgi:hypothetical protein
MSYPPPPNQRPQYQQPTNQQLPIQSPGFLPYATWQQPPAFKHSGFGLISFIIGMLMGIFEFGVIAFATVAATAKTSSQAPAMEIAGCGMILGLLICVAGVIFGIVGLKQPDRKKVFSVIGLCSNALILLGVLGLVVIGLAMK